MIERDWTQVTAIANSDDELHDKINDGWRVRTVRGEIGTVTDAAIEENCLVVEFDDSEDGTIHVGAVAAIARPTERFDHSGREPDDTGRAAEILEDALSGGEMDT